MLEIEREVLRLCEEGGVGCLATLVRSSGSVPMSRRARMLVRADGSMLGTVGGGCLEAEVWQRARDLLSGQGPSADVAVAPVLRFALNQEDAEDSGMVCGGSVEILLERVEGRETAEMYRRILALRSSGRRGLLATVVSAAAPTGATAGRHLLVEADGSVWGDLGDPGLAEAVLAEAPRVMREEMPRLGHYVPDGSGLLSAADTGSEARARVFLDPVVPVPALYVFGAGHVGLHTAHLGALTGMRVVVVDDRPDFASRERFPDADEVRVADFGEAVAQLPVDENSYVVIVTRGHRHDETVLRQALATPARYIGMIGSRRKVKLTLDRLRAEGIPEAQIARVHAPIGLEIHADTPEEIAVSILAEIIAIRRGGRG